MTDNKQTTAPVTTNWSDFGHRIIRAVYTSLAAAFPATIAADVAGGGFDRVGLQHIGISLAVAALNGIITALKAGIAQGRGSNPADGALK